MHNSLAIDIFNHLKNDTALMPGAAANDWLDPGEHQTLPEIMGTNVANFHHYCVFAPQNYPIEEYLPLIWFSVSIKNGKHRYEKEIDLIFRIFSHDTSGVEIGKIADRLILLLDGIKSQGQYLWNACPLTAENYAIPYRNNYQSAIDLSSLHEIYRQTLTFRGIATRMPDARGR